MIKLVGDRLVNTSDFRLRDNDIELRIETDDNSEFYILVMNRIKRFNLSKLGSLLIWTLPILQNERISIAIEAKKINSSEILFTTNEIIIKQPKLEDSYDIIDMFDEHKTIQIVDRNILLNQNFIVSVEGDRISQLMEFQVARYFDGIDRLDTDISIIYVNAIGEEYIFKALNISKTDEKIRFNWLLEDTVSIAYGNVSFKIQFSRNNYLWQTLPCQFKVMPTLDVDSVIIERFPSKLTDLNNRVIALESADSLTDTDNIILSNEFKVIGTSIGALNDGDIVEAGKTLTYLLNKIRSKTIPPTYVQPTLSIEGSLPMSVEIGSNITPTISALFKQNNAGTITNYTLKKNNIIILNTNNTQTHTDTQFQITGNVNYSASASFNDGVILNDNMGYPYPDGQILAGTIESNKVIYNAYRYGFYGYKTSPAPITTSNEVRSLNNRYLNVQKGTQFTLIVPIGSQYVGIGYLETLGDISSIRYVELSTEYKGLFDLKTINVEGNSGYLAVPYKYYEWIIPVPTGALMTLQITI